MRCRALKGQTGQNIVTVLANERGCGLQQAVVDAVAMRDRMMCLFLRLSDRLLPGASVELRSYLSDLGHLLRGNIEWSMRVPRYNSLGSADQPPGRTATMFPGWADQPADGSLEPLPLPAIAWWWNQLDS